MTRLISLSLLLAAATVTPALAATPTVASLEAQAQVMPRDGGAQIELAQAYVRAGRAADAEKAYRRALALNNEMMETRNGAAIWSHQVARLALPRTTAMASR